MCTSSWYPAAARAFAPDSISARVNEIPGVGKAEFRVVADVTLDVPGLDEPAKGRIVSIPDEQVAMLNDLYIKEGRYIEAGQTNEVLGGVLLGIAIGWYFGFKITALYMEFFRFPVLRYAPGPIVIATAILISLSAAAVGALGAVRRTISLPPAEAMRPEAPAGFRTNVIERLRIHQLVPTSVRIILRNLERRPLKAMLSITGTALAAALLVIGFFLYFDTIERIIDIQFNEVQREDVSVVFHEPRPAAVKYDLAGLPGVIRVEPYRAVPVRLHFAHRTRRTVLLGLQDSAELRRVVAKDLQTATMPPEGLLLNTKLAEILNEAKRAGQDNPLARILKLQESDGHKLTVATTTEHLAQRLGHAVEKAFGGQVRYNFSHENKIARVSWHRN